MNKEKTATKERVKRPAEESAKGPIDVKPLNLEVFGGDTVGYCDPETGICTVPGVGDKAVPADQRGKYAEDKATDNPGTDSNN